MDNLEDACIELYNEVEKLLKDIYTDYENFFKMILEFINKNLGKLKELCLSK